jgi:hypothetical protein
MRCAACSPLSAAVASSHVSAIQRRRVMRFIVAHSRWMVPCAETRRGTLFAFPFSVAFLLLPYFFFAAFFAAFFAGFLAAFFVAMVVYSPFSM